MNKEQRPKRPSSASSIESFEASSELSKKDPVPVKDNRKVPTIIKISQTNDQPFEKFQRPMSPTSIKRNIDFGVDMIANSKKLSVINTSGDTITGTNKERMDEHGLINTVNENSNIFQKHTMHGYDSDNSEKSRRSGKSARSGRSGKSGMSGMIGLLERQNSDYSGSDQDDIDDSTSYSEESVKLSNEQILKEKQSMLVKLARLERRGYNPSKKYTMNDTYNELKSVVDGLEYEKNRDDAVKLQRKGLMTVVSILEYLNTSYNPFDLYLDGWTESVFENLDDYDDVFEELYEKYKTNVEVSPEIKLIGMVGGSALMFHFTKALFSKSNDVPNFNDVMNNNPELKRQYVEAASKEYGNNRRSNQRSGGGSGNGGGSGGGLFGNIFNMFGGDSGGAGGGIGDLLGGLMGGGGGGNGGGGGASNNTGKFEAPDNVADLLNGFTDDQTSTLDISNDEEYSDLSSTDMEQLKSIKPMKS